MRSGLSATLRQDSDTAPHGSRCKSNCLAPRAVHWRCAPGSPGSHNRCSQPLFLPLFHLHLCRCKTRDVEAPLPAILLSLQRSLAASPGHPQRRCSYPFSHPHPCLPTTSPPLLVYLPLSPPHPP